MSNEEKTITISVTLKNGHGFEHQYPKEPDDELLKFIEEIIDELAKTRKGILTLPSQFGIYQMEDISSIHFLDTELDNSKLPMGFHSEKAKS